MLKKPCLKVQNLQYKFLDWKWPPPLLELFRKNIRFGRAIRPLVTEKFWKGASMPIYIGWCFLDLNWTFYRALLPIYIKNDTVVLVAHHARTAILTDSCQVFVLILYLCNDSVLITFILWSLPCPKVSNRWGSHHFVVKSTNEILNMPMYVCMTDNCIGLKHNFNCICYLSPSVYIVT